MKKIFSSYYECDKKMSYFETTKFIRFLFDNLDYLGDTFLS